VIIMQLGNTRSSRSIVPCLVAAAIAVATFGGIATASAQRTTTVVVVEHRHALRPRLRFGLSGEGGGFFGATYGGAAGLAPRIGVQFNDVVAVYVQAHLLLGNLEPDRPDARFAGFAFHEAIFELTVADRFQFGAGPSIDFVWGCDANDGRAWCGRGDGRFGGDFRFAVALGGDGPGRRHGVVFSMDAHPTWLDPNFATMFLFGIGGELY
jgi:hypothetical protein